MKKKKIGFFGGTFDPIHFGHLNLAIELSEIHQLDEVLFCPAYCSPFKEGAAPQASPEERLEMVRLAISDIPHFRFTDYEVERSEISYTINTLRALQSEGDFHLLLADEEAAHFEKWREFQELLKIAPPLIGLRSSSHQLPKALRPGLTPTKRFDISSTEIRSRLKQGLYCGHLVPAIVLKYIETQGQYI